MKTRNSLLNAIVIERIKYMLQKGLTVDKIEDLVDIIKQDKDFEVERWEFRPKAKALWIYDKKDQQTVVTLKIVDDKIVVNSVW